MTEKEEVKDMNPVTLEGHLQTAHLLFGEVLLRTEQVRRYKGLPWLQLHHEAIEAEEDNRPHPGLQWLALLSLRVSLGLRRTLGMRLLMVRYVSILLFGQRLLTVLHIVSHSQAVHHFLNKNNTKNAGQQGFGPGLSNEQNDHSADLGLENGCVA